MRKLMVIVFFYFISLIAKSQNLVVDGTAPNLFINHIVAPKENFYSISRLYNQSPKLIASFNKIVMEKGLTIGEHIKIPLNNQNFDNTGKSGNGIPLTHIVAKSETVFRIGGNVNVTPESIRKWNKLSTDKIALGTPLIVGYLKTSASKSNIASTTDNNKPAVEGAVKIRSKPAATEAKKETSTPDNTTANKEETTKEIKKPDESTETVNEAKKSVDAAVTVAGKDTAIAVAENTAAAAKEEPTRQQETPLRKNDENKTVTQTTETAGVVAGTFEEIYAKQASQKTENTKSGEAATFKSTSGWQDKKYYVLINDIAPGTIIKISSSDNKAVYAKVLGSMPEMKENTGLLLRISNAAASDLGIIDPKFSVQVSYYQ